MAKDLYNLNDFSGGINSLRDPRDINNNELSDAQNVSLAKQGSIKSSGSLSSHSTAQSITSEVVSGHGLVSFQADYQISETAIATLSSSRRLVINLSGTNFGLSDASGNLESDFDDNFSTGDIVFINIADDSSNIPTLLSSAFVVTEPLSSGLISIQPRPLAAGQVLHNFGSGAGVDSGTISKRTLGENLIALADSNTGSVDIYSGTSDKWNNTSSSPENNPKLSLVFNDSGTTTNVTLASDSKMSYYVADGNIRASDANFDNAIRIKWYGLVKRDHFGGLNYADNHFGYIEAFNGLDAPSDGAVGSGSPDAGEGFDINISLSDDENSGWVADVYQIAMSFIYDDVQESLLYIPSSSNTFTVESGQKVSYTVQAKKPYSGRISGARIYFRPNGSDSSPWVLLSDISLSEGARASLDANYEAWAYTSGTTNAIFTTGTVESLSPVLDTYETINGFPPTVPAITISANGEAWKTAVVTNRRSFVANVKIRKEGSVQSTVFGDRIMYSMPNRFDTFPTFNFIDVVKGDAEDYVKLESYADRLLAYKQKSMQVLNISSPSDTNWFLETDVKHNGVKNPGAVFRTDFGVTWVNDNGCYIYDGQNIVNLIDNKIDDSTWSSFINDASIVGYEKRTKQIIVLKNEDGSASATGDAYVYDIKSRSWSRIGGLATDQKRLSNFAIDFNGDLIVAEDDGSGTVSIKKFTPDVLKSSSAGNWIVKTKDIDFGQPGVLKKIYNIYVTFKSDNAQPRPIYYAIDGSNSFNQMFGDFSASSSWTKLRAHAGAIFTCQSIAIKIANPTNASGSSDGIQINDIAIEYRIVRNARVA